MPIQLTDRCLYLIYSRICAPFAIVVSVITEFVFLSFFLIAVILFGFILYVFLSCYSFHGHYNVVGWKYSWLCLYFMHLFIYLLDVFFILFTFYIIIFFFKCICQCFVSINNYILFILFYFFFNYCYYKLLYVIFYILYVYIIYLKCMYFMWICINIYLCKTYTLAGSPAQILSWLMYVVFCVSFHSFYSLFCVVSKSINYQTIF